jgi:hypothetical protein
MKTWLWSSPIDCVNMLMMMGINVEVGQALIYLVIYLVNGARNIKDQMTNLYYTFGHLKCRF